MDKRMKKVPKLLVASESLASPRATSKFSEAGSSGAGHAGRQVGEKTSRENRTPTPAGKAMVLSRRTSFGETSSDKVKGKAHVGAACSSGDLLGSLSEETRGVVLGLKNSAGSVKKVRQEEASVEEVGVDAPNHSFSFEHAGSELLNHDKEASFELYRKIKHADSELFPVDNDSCGVNILKSIASYHFMLAASTNKLDHVLRKNIDKMHQKALDAEVVRGAECAVKENVLKELEAYKKKAKDVEAAAASYRKQREQYKEKYEAALIAGAREVENEMRRALEAVASRYQERFKRFQRFYDGGGAMEEALSLYGQTQAVLEAFRGSAKEGVQFPDGKISNLEEQLAERDREARAMHVEDFVESDFVVTPVDDWVERLTRPEEAAPIINEYGSNATQLTHAVVSTIREDDAFEP